MNLYDVNAIGFLLKAIGDYCNQRAVAPAVSKTILCGVRGRYQQARENLKIFNCFYSVINQCLRNSPVNLMHFRY